MALESEVAVFAAVPHPDGEGILTVRRPDDDEDLPGAWGLPATTLGDDESFEDGIRRIGREKLGVELVPTGFIGRRTVDRGEFILHGEEFWCSILEGEIEVPQDGPRTQYTEWRWGDAEDLIPAAEQGSLCSRIYLEHEGMADRIDD